MNKQELIKKVVGNGTWCTEDYTGEKDRYVKISKVRELIDLLDEPQQPVVPKFVAEWIEYAKKKGDSLAISFKPWNLYGVEYSKADRWIDDNQEMFARAWLDGYEVEKETKWRVYNPDSDEEWRDYLARFIGDNLEPIWRHLGEENPLIFTNKERADAVAVIVDGKVEEVA